MKNFDTTLFGILGGLPENATQEEINTAYRLLAQLYHPDKNPNRPGWSSEKMKQLNEAKEILSDPIKRKQYEKMLKEKIAAKEREKVNFQPNQNRNPILNQRTLITKPSNNELKAVFGLAAVFFLLEAISD